MNRCLGLITRSVNTEQMCRTRSVNRCVGLGLVNRCVGLITRSVNTEQMCRTRSVNRCVGLGL